MDYRVSKPTDRPRLERIAERCFGDGPAYRQLLLGQRYRPEQCLVAADHEDRAVASAYLFPFTLTGAEELEAAYVYAVGVDPDYQGRQIGTRLMDFLWHTLEERGIPLAVLVPASPSLFDYYRRLGYRPFGQLGRGVPMAPPAGRPMALRRCTPQEYFTTREGLLRDIPHGRWDQEALAYQQAFSVLTQGNLFLLDEGVGCAVAEPYEGTLYVKELLAPPQRLGEALAGLSQGFPGWGLELRTRPDWAPWLGLPVQDFSMARWAGDTPPSQGYFALALD